MSATEITLAASLLVIAGGLSWEIGTTLLEICSGWRRCGRCGAWWSKARPKITYVNQPDECSFAIKSTCHKCQQP